MKTIISILTLLSSIAGWSSEASVSAKWTVKVFSEVCKAQSKSFIGSGYVFSHSGNTYVLTSEHVVLHGNDRFCHHIWNASLGSRKGRLRAVEYGNGLALLQLDEFQKEAPLLEDLEITRPMEGMAIHVMGFPYKSKSLIANNPGRILVPESRRKYIPIVPHMVESIHAHGEFGMSGGPVSDKEGAFVGVLSHQYLKIVLGRSQLVGEFSSGASVKENHLLVIPARHVLEWVRSVLSEKEPYAAFFVRNAEAQLQGKNIVLSSGLQFEFIGAATHAGTGGADGAGTGGADGAGTGGNENADSNRNVNRSHVRISYDSVNPNTIWFEKRLQPWLINLRNSLSLPWNSVEVPFFLTSRDNKIEIERIESLPDFFQKLSLDQLEAITLVKSKVDGPRNPNPLQTKEVAAVEELVSHGEKIREIVEVFRKEEWPPEASVLIDEIKTVSQLLTPTTWFYLKRVRRELESLTVVESRTVAWKPLFNRQFEESVNLLERLKKVSKILKDILILEEKN